MTKGMKITTPDGYQIEIDHTTLNSLSRDKLAQIMSVISKSSPNTVATQDNSITLEQIANSDNKKYWIALFLANYYALDFQVSTNDIHKAWTQEVVSQNYDKFYLSKSNMNEYLNRLTDDGFVKKSITKPIFWQITEKLTTVFPNFQLSELPQLISNSI